MKYRVEACCGGESDFGKWGTLPQALSDIQLIEDSAKLMKKGDDELDKNTHLLKELGGTPAPIRRKSETWTARVMDENHKVYKSKSWTVRVIV